MNKLGLFIMFSIFCSNIIGQGRLYCDSLLEDWDTIENSLPFNEKIISLHKILGQFKKDSDKKCISNCYRRLGIIYYEKGELDTANSNFLKAATISDEIQDHHSSSSNFNQLGAIYYALQSYEKAIYYFKKAYNTYNNINFLRGVSDATNNIANIYGLLDSTQQMYDYIQISLRARYKSKDTTDIGYNYNSLGIYYSKTNNIDSSLKYLTLSISSFALNKNASALISAYNAVGDIYLGVKKYNTSISYFNKALDTAYKYQNRPLLAETYGYLANAYQARGDTLQAYKYLKLESVLKDDLLDDNKVKAIIAAERKYDSQAKTSKITEQANQIKIKNLWLVIIAIISISILVIAFLLIRGYRNRQRIAQKEIDEQRRRVDDLMQKQEVENVNAMLKGQDEERKRIAQELHDRIGSILSTVKLHFTNVEAGIALLKEQQNKSYTEAVGLLDEAVDEVRRISHDLYEGSLAKFGFKTALLQLITAIEKANIVRVTFMDNGVERDIYMEFEQDLYRITQELLSNSLKYAHAKEISIQLNEKQGVLEFMYEDDGVGFNSQKIQTSAGIGYKNIAARVSKMGGSWHLDALPNHGMTLIIELPIDYGKD